MSVRKEPQSMVPTTGTLPAEKKPLRRKTHLEIRISTFYNLNSHIFQGPTCPSPRTQAGGSNIHRGSIICVESRICYQPDISFARW